ncbi:MAG: sterol desaturase family protein [Bdellovibrionota bacterium]|nr:sterol desaturase family protein [Bdellovibrionota bacterium]
MKNYESIRIFKNPILEWTTHVHPIVPLLLWVPVVCYWYYEAATKDHLSFSIIALVSLVGLIVWTLTEYLLHRFVFHMKVIGPITERFVFLFHGLHHDDPNDPTRLVMPPVPAILIVTLLYYLFSLVVPSVYMKAFMASFIIGYLIYDYIHYATHHFKMTSSLGRYLKKWHLQHHFRGEKSKYGVSSPLWDYIFRTVTGPKEDH